VRTNESHTDRVGRDL